MRIEIIYPYGKCSALACACANVLTSTAGSVKAEDVERILPQVSIEIDHECLA
jgi:hypothetical protein